MADQIVVMRDGVIEQAGAPLDLYDDPNNVFVATFIGSPAMNLLEGTVQHSNGTTSVKTAVGSELPMAFDVQAETGRHVYCGIRPEHFEHTDRSAEGALPVEVAVVEPTGAETLVICRIDGQEDGQELQTVFRERHDFKSGQHISVAPMREKALLFDVATGNRIR